MTYICTICARGGSKGVKNKNILPLAGKPLIAHSIMHAKATGLFAAVAVSSDCDHILETAQAWGADMVIKRPDEMAQDTSAKLPAIQHAARTVEERLGRRVDVVCDLDATAPLRLPEDIVGSIRLLETTRCSNVLSACPARKTPYFNMLELTGDGYARFSKPLPATVVRRQDAPAVYEANASIYVWWRDTLLESETVLMDHTRLFMMPEERSLDIDKQLDFDIVEYLMGRRQDQ